MSLTKEEYAKITRYVIEKEFELELTNENIKYCLTQKKDIAASLELSFLFMPIKKQLEVRKQLHDFHLKENKVEIASHLVMMEILFAILCALNVDVTNANEDGFNLSESTPIVVDKLDRVRLLIKRFDSDFVDNDQNLINWVVKRLYVFGFIFDDNNKLKIRNSMIPKIAFNLSKKFSYDRYIDLSDSIYIMFEYSDMSC